MDSFDCTALQETLRHDGLAELSETVFESLVAHVEGCPACRALLDSLPDPVVDEIGPWPVSAPDPARADDIRDRIAPAPHPVFPSRRRAPWRFLTSGWFPAATLAAAALVLAIAFWPDGRGDPPMGPAAERELITTLEMLEEEELLRDLEVLENLEMLIDIEDMDRAASG